MPSLNSPLTYTAVIAVVTVLVNLGLAYSGQTQKLSCTIEQTAAVAAAVQMATSTQ